MAYYGTNMVLAQAHWVSSGSFDLKSAIKLINSEIKESKAAFKV